jgi:hypothetical protein
MRIRGVGDDLLIIAKEVFKQTPSVQATVDEKLWNAHATHHATNAFVRLLGQPPVCVLWSSPTALGMFSPEG